MKVIRVILVVSVVLNAILASTVVFGITHHSVDSPALSAWNDTKVVNVSESGSASQSAQSTLSIFKKATLCGLPDDASKRLLADSLVRLDAVASPYEYWEPLPHRQAVHRSSMVDASDKARATIVATFGESAREDAAFSTLFRPLDPELNFLSSEKQISLERLQLDADLRRAEILRHGATGATPMDIQRQIPADVARLLEPKELFEYHLRRSPTAQMLLASSFDFTEEEFRNVFRAAMARNAAAPGAMASASYLADAVREGLSDERYEEYRRTKAPALVAQTGTRPSVVIRD